MLTQEVKNELLAMNLRQRNIVLEGLHKKLGFYNRTGILSYKYEVCPVCKDVGSTLENPRCEKCYLKIGCKEPFNKGFRDDPEKGYEYFDEMRKYLLKIEVEE